MRRRSLVLLPGMLFWPPTQASASQEGMLGWSSFAVESSGIGASGVVRVTGTRRDRVLTSFTVEAFGRTFVLREAQLQQLTDFFVNGMQLSYEHGYPELGGRTLYILVSGGFISGVRSSKLIRMSERGDIEISRVRG